MSAFTDFPIRSLADVVRFESEKTLDERYDARSVYDVFLKSAAHHPDRTALTMLMTGADDETPRLVSYRQLLEGVGPQCGNEHSITAGLDGTLGLFRQSHRRLPCSLSAISRRQSR